MTLSSLYDYVRGPKVFALPLAAVVCGVPLLFEFLLPLHFFAIIAQFGLLMIGGVVVAWRAYQAMWYTSWETGRDFAYAVVAILLHVAWLIYIVDTV
jgi:hypothetical protein